MKTIKWGIIGLGNIAGKFASDLARVADSELYAVASRSQDKADAFKKIHGAVKAYGSYEELAQDPDVDVVYIATPHVRHRDDSILCMESGRAVLCEKPFAMNRDQVESMIASAKANDVLLMEAMWTRMMPSFRFVMDEITSGKYGKIKTITADFGFKAPFDAKSRLFDKSLGGGALLDIGIYPIFVALALLGKPENISAKAKIGKTGVDELNEMTFTYPDDTKAFLSSNVMAKTPTSATILCENGLLYLHPRFHHAQKVTSILEGVKTEHSFDLEGIGYTYEIAHVAELLRDGKKESPLMTFDLSRDLISTLDKVKDQIGLQYPI